MKLICSLFSWLKSLDLLVKRIAQRFCHVVVKPQSGDNSGLTSHFAVVANASACSRQAYNVLTSPITARGNAIDHQFSALSQIDKERLVAGLYGHQTESPFIDCDGEAYALDGSKWSRS